MKVEEALCYLHTITDEEYGFYHISDNFVENRKSDRSNPFHMPCELIKKDTLFIYRSETKPGSMKTSCIEAPFETYQKIISDDKIMSFLKRKEGDVNDMKGYDIEEELTPIEEALQNRMIEIRDEKLNIILK
jgi:hypothetical protein